MLERLLESPFFTLGALLFVAYMAGVYFLNRERADVQRMRGRKRFSPDWSKSRHGRRRRRRIGRSSRSEFRPEWPDRARDTDSATERPESKGDAASPKDEQIG